MLIVVEIQIKQYGFFSPLFCFYYLYIDLGPLALEVHVLQANTTEWTLCLRVNSYQSTGRTISSFHGSFIRDSDASYEQNPGQKKLLFTFGAKVDTRFSRAEI